MGKNSKEGCRRIAIDKYILLVLTVIIFIGFMNSFGSIYNIASAKDSSVNFARPTYGNFSSPFGMRNITGKPEMHRGIDIANAQGTPIYAVYDGVVSMSEVRPQNGGMIYVTLHHTINGKKYTTIYAHLMELGVAKGTKVKKGDVIGKMGNTGRSFGHHLHFQVHEGIHAEFYGSTWDKGVVDPMKFYKDKDFSKGNLSKGGKDLTGMGDNDAANEEDSSDESSDSNSGGDDEYTGALEFDPFIKGKPVQNTTGIDYKNKEIGASEGYIFASFFSKVIYIIMLVALVLTAIYIVSIALVIFGISFDSPLIAENKFLNRLAGRDFVDSLRTYGVSGCIKQIGIRFGVPIVVLLLVVVGVVGQLQFFLVDKLIQIFELLFG